MTAIHGHSVFSQDAVRDSVMYKQRGGLTGGYIVSIEDLNKKVDAFWGKPEWLPDYEKIRARREECQRHVWGVV